jgi:hypothetical protein
MGEDQSMTHIYDGVNYAVYMVRQHGNNALNRSIDGRVQFLSRLTVLSRILQGEAVERIDVGTTLFQKVNR